jgi:uncharacterized protein (TIGR04222 family)
MNRELWQKIQDFDFDGPGGDYTFTIRLAKENNWTHHFTQQALLEYRKFMYLAATSNVMVSPSEIVDIVWHQHLIFSQSYTEFCTRLGKNIPHIPSTHSRQEHEKFHKARESTTAHYNAVFGKQPSDIWEHNTIFGPMHLHRSRFTTAHVILTGIVAVVLLLLPAYHLLRPLYLHIPNPWFIMGYFVLALGVYLALGAYNKRKLLQLLPPQKESGFLYNLTPYELTYAKNQGLGHVVHGIANELIVDNAIRINEDNTVTLAESTTPQNREQAQVMAVLDEFEYIAYHNLVKRLVNKPVFNSISGAMDALQQHVAASRQFMRLYLVNFAITAALLIPGYVRFFTGVSRNRPVLFIFAICLGLTLLAGYHLWKLPKLLLKEILPQLYASRLLTKEDFDSNWQWVYFAAGTAVLYPAFIPLVKHNPDKAVGGDGGSGSASCGSSCGSSCGGGCGGCGGGD